MIIKDENSIQGAVHKLRNAMGVGGQQKHYYNIAQNPLQREWGNFTFAN